MFANGERFVFPITGNSTTADRRRDELASFICGRKKYRVGIGSIAKIASLYANTYWTDCANRTPQSRPKQRLAGRTHRPYTASPSKNISEARRRYPSVVQNKSSNGRGFFQGVLGFFGQ